VVDDRPEGGAPRRWWSKGAWTLAALLGALAVILWATGSSASASSGYRTAEASVATVRQTLAVSGTTDPVHQATADFQVAGTVSAVDAVVGQQVAAGETLANLDTTSLAQAVSSAQLSVSSAEATLSENEAGESTGTSSSSSSPSSGSSAVSLTAVVTSTATVSSQASGIAQDQRAVVDTQQTADADSATAAADFAQTQTACTTSGTGGGTTTTTTTTPTTTTTAPSSTTTTPASMTTTPASTTTTPTTTTPTGASTACTDALSRTLAAQQLVTTDQKAVATAESTLEAALSSSSNSTGSSTGTTSGSGAGVSGGTGSSTKSGVTSGASGSGTTSGGTSSSSGTSGETADSAAQLASDQASIDSAKATLIEAQQSLADAQLTTPISGTVASVALTVGESVTAGSTSDDITIINSGSYEVTASLTSTQASQVKVGNKALVSVDGGGGTLNGTVARVGPVDSTGSSDTYPLIVALSAGSHGISAGSTAQVQVILHQVEGTLSVPTSAVHVTGTHSSYVEVLRSGQAVRKKVTVGAIGGAYTQITSGLEKGTSVVLADLSKAVPTSSTSTSTSRFGGGGSGFPSGGGLPSGAGFGA